MAPVTAEEERTRYSTRLKGRLQNVQKKYDDIFSAVFQKTRSTECLSLVPSYRGRRRLATNSVCLPVELFFEDQSNRPRSMSECDSLAISDCSQDTSSGSQSPISEENDIEIIEEKEEEPVEGKYKCDCGSFFSKHHQLHEHIVTDHAFARLFRCTSCSITIKGIRNNYVCRICKQFIPSGMDAHLKKHYQDRSGENAFMECRCCYRSFKTINEVRDHERRVHYAHRPKQIQWPCDYCTKTFNTRHNRDAHLVGHVSSAVGGIWEKIAQMQELLTDQTLVNQCPICDSVMGSRKSFRLHIIHKHLLRDTSYFISSMGLPTVSEVLKAMRAASGIKEPKKEVKEEVEDAPPSEEQPLAATDVKSEPAE